MPSVCVIGSGAAGLITAKTLQDDGFDVCVLTRDRSPGGVWAEERVYPGLRLNNVHGEFRFSCLPMPPPQNAKATGGRLDGNAMQRYMESFADRFLAGRIRYNVEVLNVSRNMNQKWVVKIKNPGESSEEELVFDKVVLCTGGCSEAQIPQPLSPPSAGAVGFSGLVFHSTKFKANLENLLSKIPPKSETIVVVGGGKSAQDIVAYLVNQGRNVKMVFEKADAFVAAPTPLPDFIRKSRRFLHTTTLGSVLTRAFWNFLTWSSFFTFSVPAPSPFRNAHSLFWGIRTNDEGVGAPSSFFSLVKQNKVDVIAPARVRSFSADGKGVMLDNGETIEAGSVILCTGFKSSWDALFDEKTREELGLRRQVPDDNTVMKYEFDRYLSLANPPDIRPKGNAEAESASSSSMYRGIVPAQNLFRRDFAVNGSVFTTNNGYTFEVASHWISSYFLADAFLVLPPSTSAALAQTQQTSAWLRKRYPGMLAWVNESYSAGVAFWNYPQVVDELLEDMQLPAMRSGGSWLTWPFEVVDLREIEDLHGERLAKRGY